MASIAFMPPRDAVLDGAAFFPHPQALTDWPDNKPEPDYEGIYVVRIDDANPAHFKVNVRRIEVGALRSQKELDTSHLKQAETAPVHASANTGRNLNLKFKAKEGALIIFHLTDPNATFVDADADGRPTHGVVKSANESDLLFNALWVKGHDQDREAVSVILDRADQRIERQYGLGVRLNNDDDSVPREQRYTDIIIDPKVENEGNG